MEDGRGLPVARPVVLTAGLEDQPIFWLYHAFHQAHVILLSEGPQGDDGTHDRSRLHTHQDSGMNAAGNWDAIFGDHVEFHAMFIAPPPVGLEQEWKGQKRGQTAVLVERLFPHHAPFAPWVPVEASGCIA